MTGDVKNFFEVSFGMMELPFTSLKTDGQQVFNNMPEAAYEGYDSP